MRHRPAVDAPPPQDHPGVAGTSGTGLSEGLFSMTQESGAQESGGSGQAHAVRFIFEYEDDDVRLVSQQWVDVAVTGFDLAARQAMAPGNYVEMRAADGE